MNPRMTESKSVALPLGYIPVRHKGFKLIGNVPDDFNIIPHINPKVKR